MDVVVGCCGTLGPHIVDRLLAQGRNVRAVDFNDPAKHSVKISGPSNRLEQVRGDATDPKSVAQFLSGGDVENVVLAFQGHNWNSAGKVDHGGVKTVAEAAAKAGAKRVLLISSLLVTPQHKKHPLRIMLNAIRWKMMDRKFDGENALRESGVPYTIVRPGRFVEKPGKSAAKLKTGGHSMKMFPLIGSLLRAPGAAKYTLSLGLLQRRRCAAGIDFPKSDRSAGQGDKINGSITPLDVAAVCVAALQDTAMAGVTFEIIDEWAKSPEAAEAGSGGGGSSGTEELWPEPGTTDAAAPAPNAAAPGRSTPPNVETQLQTLFKGLAPDGDTMAADQLEKTPEWPDA